tara:strand:- start:480 stop:665 length:186 start_codon:yes stop_codon:yes gene_type:complete
MSFENSIYSIPCYNDLFITYIPENKHGINEGYYTINDIVSILRSAEHDPVLMSYIFNMLEL